MTREGRIRLLVVAGLIGMFEVLCRSGIIAHTVVIPPSEMARSLWQILISGGPEMVRATKAALIAKGAPPERIQHDPLSS